MKDFELLLTDIHGRHFLLKVPIYEDLLWMFSHQISFLKSFSLKTVILQYYLFEIAIGLSFLHKDATNSICITDSSF